MAKDCTVKRIECIIKTRRVQYKYRQTILSATIFLIHLIRVSSSSLSVTVNYILKKLIWDNLFYINNIKYFYNITKLEKVLYQNKSPAAQH